MITLEMPAEELERGANCSVCARPLPRHAGVALVVCEHCQQAYIIVPHHENPMSYKVHEKPHEP